MRSPRFVWSVAFILLLLDFYVFQAVKLVSQAVSPRWRTIIYGGYWTLSVLVLIIFCLMPFIRRSHSRFQGYVFFIIIGLYLAKLIVSIFLLIDW